MCDERGHYILTDSKAYMNVQPSYFKYMNEQKQKRTNQVANTKLGVHCKKSDLRQQLKVKLLSDVK